MSFNSISHLAMFLILTSAGDGVNSRPMILHNGSSAALHSQDASHLQDDILWRGPPGQGSCQLHSNHLIEKRTQVFKKNKKTDRAIHGGI